jgi:hypothetical protein
MRRLFAVLISALLIFGFAPVAKADVAGLTPCAESARFQQRAANASTPTKHCGRNLNRSTRIVNYLKSIHIYYSL